MSMMYQLINFHHIILIKMQYFIKIMILLIIEYYIIETGLKHLDYDLIRFAINCLTYYYPGLLFHMLVCKLPCILQVELILMRRKFYI
ncbi:unnamed protein product [Rotaria sordida]|uniref:Uncharacterized protein n=1 Tax=Rotaria sordida TaxID=392033 RepID=A0A813TTG3_9BILA|nr:unnamed protein product [Rotaria sordida]